MEGFVMLVKRKKRALKLPSQELIKLEQYVDLAAEMQSVNVSIDTPANIAQLQAEDGTLKPLFASV